MCIKMEYYITHSWFDWNPSVRQNRRFTKPNQMLHKTIKLQCKYLLAEHLPFPMWGNI